MISATDMGVVVTSIGAFVLVDVVVHDSVCNTGCALLKVLVVITIGRVVVSIVSVTAGMVVVLGTVLYTIAGCSGFLLSILTSLLCMFAAINSGIFALDVEFVDSDARSTVMLFSASFGVVTVISTSVWTTITSDIGTGTEVVVSMVSLAIVFGVVSNGVVVIGVLVVVDGIVVVSIVTGIIS